MSENKNSSNKKSLEEIYKEKLATKKLHAKSNKNKFDDGIEKEKKKVVQKNISAPKNLKDEQVQGKEIRVGNIVIEADMLNQAYLINKREKSRSLIITILSVLIALVIFVSGVVIYFNLSKEINGEMVVSGNGVVWLVENNEVESFYLPSELREGARVSIKIDLKKNIDEDINNISVRVRAYKDTTEITNLIMFYNIYSETNLAGFVYNPELKTFNKTDWNSENGSVLNFCTGFLIGNEISGINVTNFKIIFTVIVS